MTLYRKKPVIVEAFKWQADIETMDGHAPLPEWLEGKCAVRGTILEIWTLEGIMRANHGDWIIRGANGEVYPVKPLVPRWVEETLRYDNSTQAVARVVVTDTELYGEKLRAGDRLVLLLGAANRDERVFPDPDVYDLHRDTSEHLAFGRGIHFCLGAASPGSRRGSRSRR